MINSCKTLLTSAVSPTGSNFDIYILGVFTEKPDSKQLERSVVYIFQ